MSKFEVERLQEALMDLERSRLKEEFDRKMAEALVKGLRIISSTSNREEMFSLLFNFLKTLIPFDHCFLMREIQGMNSGELLLHPVYPFGSGVTKFESRLRQYKSNAPFSVFNVKGWETYLFNETTQESCQDGSLLVLPLATESATYWMFMLSSKRSGFSRQHISIASKMSELLKQAVVKDSYIVKLMHSNKMTALGEMAGGIAHEINNPLAIIQGSLEIFPRLLKPEDYNSVSKNIKIMERNVDRITKIIHGLKVISRGEVSKSDKALVGIKELLDDTLSYCQEKLSSLGIELHIDIDSKLRDKEFYLNRVLLSQVFLNIINNAVDAIKKNEKTWINIRVKEMKHKLHFYFVDSGKGIPDEIQNKVFQPFYTTKAVGEGTGLGLGICRSLLEQVQGEIFIDNNFINTCLHVVLPTE
jgi:signal transduction histidine kinase